MFNVLDLLDSTIKEATKANGRCSVKHATVQGTDSVTFISISRSLNDDFIPKTSLVLDQEEHGKNTTVSLNYLDANNYLELNIFFEDDSCFKGITIYADNGQPVHELASKIANSFVALGKTAIFPLLERADIQAANTSKVTHTTISSADGKLVTQMSIAKGLTANDKRRMIVVLIQDEELGTTIFSVEFVEDADILCNIFLGNGTSYQGIKIRDNDKEVCRTFAWKLINQFIENGEAAFIEILPKPIETKKETTTPSPAVNLLVSVNGNTSSNLSFKVDSKSAEKLQEMLCAKLATPKEREDAMLELLGAIESHRIQKDDSIAESIKEYGPKNSRFLFPEMRIEIPASFEEPAFFTLYRSDKLKLRFRLSGRKSMEARARQLLDIIDGFKISPEKLALCHESLLVDEVYPTTREDILYLTNLYHCNRKLAPQNSKVTLLSSDGSLNVNFTRYKKNGSALNLSISFLNKELQISIKEKRYFFSHIRKFILPIDFLDTQDNIDTLFVAFYNDKNGSIDKCGLKGSLLVYFLESRSHQEEESSNSNSSMLMAS